MFQSEPILWLHQFASSGVTRLMLLISDLGASAWAAALLLVLAFGYRVRPSMTVLAGLLLAGLVTNAVKEAVRFPRPSDVDDRVLRGLTTQPAHIVARAVPRTFWALPTPEARQAVRDRPGHSYGVPSGHVSAAAALAVGLLLVFRARALLVLAIGWPVLMALSRMYLGRHYLADVVIGAAIGVSSAWVAAGLMSRVPPFVPSKSVFSASVIGVAFFVIVGLIPGFDAEIGGRLAGLLVVTTYYLRFGAPVDPESVAARLSRVAVAAALYVLLDRGSNAVLDAARFAEHHGAALAAAAVTIAGPFVLSHALFMGGPVP